MKKQLLGFIVAVTGLFLLMSVSCLAEERKKTLTINVPESIVYQVEEWNGSSALKAVYMLSEELFAVINMTPEKLSENYGCQEIVPYLVFDWSLDQEDGWHYEETWDQEDVMAMPLYVAVGPGVVNEAEVFWLAHEQQCDFFKECIKCKGQEENKLFDYEAHTLYIRAKYLFKVTGDDGIIKRLSSDWSKTQKIDKDYEVELDLDQLGIPVLKDTKIIKGINGTFRNLCYVCEYPKELVTTLLKLNALTGENFEIEGEIRYNGGDWEDAKLSSSSMPYHYGERTLSLYGFEEKDKFGIQFRVRFRYKGNKERRIDAFVTSWSDVATIGMDYWKEEPASKEADAKVMLRNRVPYGLCQTILFGAIVLGMLLLLVLSPKHKNKGE